MPEARDGYFTTYYAFNKIILDVITVKFDIQVDDKTITQPTHNLPTLEFVLPPVDDNEDLILKEENPKIYVHLFIKYQMLLEIQHVRKIFKTSKMQGNIT